MMVLVDETMYRMPLILNSVFSFGPSHPRAMYVIVVIITE